MEISEEKSIDLLEHYSNKRNTSAKHLMIAFVAGIFLVLLAVVILDQSRVSDEVFLGVVGSIFIPSAVFLLRFCWFQILLNRLFNIALDLFGEHGQAGITSVYTVGSGKNSYTAVDYSFTTAFGYTHLQQATRGWMFREPKRGISMPVHYIPAAPVFHRIEKPRMQAGEEFKIMLGVLGAVLLFTLFAFAIAS